MRTISDASRRLGLVVLAWAFTSQCALALEGGVEDSNDSATFAGVGSLTVSGPNSGTYSAVLIAPQYVLTAGHVAGPGADPSAFTFNVNLKSLGDTERRFSVTSITPAPGFNGFLSGQITRNDLSILKLDRAVSDRVPRYELLTAPLTINETITLVGYGGTGATTKRQGNNLIQYLDPGSPAQADVFAYDFDTDTVNQATVVGGDSGSGTFVKEGDVWKLAGINTFSWENPNPSLPGTTVRGGGGMIASAYAPWIRSVTAVPEPTTWALLCPGMVLMLWLARHTAPRRGNA